MLRVMPVVDEELEKFKLKYPQFSLDASINSGTDLENQCRTNSLAATKMVADKTFEVFYDACKIRKLAYQSDIGLNSLFQEKQQLTEQYLQSTTAYRASLPNQAINLPGLSEEEIAKRLALANNVLNELTIINQKILGLAIVVLHRHKAAFLLFPTLDLAKQVSGNYYATDNLIYRLNLIDMASANLSQEALSFLQITDSKSYLPSLKTGIYDSAGSNRSEFFISSKDYIKATNSYDVYLKNLEVKTSEPTKQDFGVSAHSFGIFPPRDTTPSEPVIIEKKNGPRLDSSGK